MNDGDPTFESALAELETIADSLERDDLDLDQALSLFERGIERLRMAGRLLDSAHGKVEELIQGATDTVETRPLDAEGEGDGGSGPD
ncbi:MAG: exodeoxyribonuclease VII small subunit [Gemmatimonadetes bacterium]|nr:exodeoxyribonuclease VII small subunit [Gemmatimonadota bacterium]